MRKKRRKESFRLGGLGINRRLALLEAKAESRKKREKKLLGEIN